jgi:two-component system nitrate/nitrite response regulator NarL
LGIYASFRGFAILETNYSDLLPSEVFTNMTKVTLYSVQPVLIAGFQAILDSLDGFTGSVCTSLTNLMGHIGTEQPQLIVFEVTSTIDLDTLSKVTACYRNTAIILWVEDVSAEFASQAISLGVRGLLRRSLPLETQARCLEKVAAGELWVEKTLTSQLLSSQRIALTLRERQLVVLVAQGLRNKEIAYALGITEGTVKVYLSRLFGKTGVSDRLELALFALKNLFVNRTSEMAPPAFSPGAGSQTGALVPAAEFIPSFICVERGRFGSRA